MEKYYVVVTNDEQYEDLKSHIEISNVIAYDTETTGLNVRKERVIGFSVSGEEGVGYYYPLFKWNGMELEEANCMAKGIELLMLLKQKKLIIVQIVMSSYTQKVIITKLLEK